MITFKLQNGNDDIAVVEFMIDSGVITPEELRALNPPDPICEKFADKIVVISGKGPIWLYTTLTNFYHCCKAVAINDPRIGWVVTQTHCNTHAVGDVIKIE
mgnify:FL=1